MMGQDLEDSSLVDEVLARISSRGDKTAQFDAKTGKRLSYEDVCRMVNNVAYLLQSAGIGSGSVIAIFSENCLEYVSLIFGILKVKATAALYSPALISRELQHCLSVTQPVAIYALNLRQEQKETIEKLKIKIFEWSLEEIIKNKENKGKFTEKCVNKSIPAFFLSSSGSTGLPKAVSLSHSNMICSLKNLSRIIMKADSPALGLVPFFHAYGLGLMLMALWEDSPLVVMSKFTPEEFSSALITYKVEYLHIVPSILNQIVKGCINRDCLKSVRAVYTGAGPVLPKVQSAALDLLEPGTKLYHGFGMTETTHVVSIGEVHPDKPGSSGYLLPFMKAKIIGNNGETLATGEKGELCISGPMVISGYYENPIANKESFTCDGYLKTGDFAWIDKDNYVYIVDRIKDIVKFQGYQVSITEIELLINQQPGVSEVAVVGVPHEVYGEVPRAFVVPNEKEKPSEEQIIEAVKKELSHYKWLRGGVRFVESLPKTHSMKIMRKELRTLP